MRVVFLYVVILKNCSLKIKKRILMEIFYLEWKINFSCKDSACGRCTSFIWFHQSRKECCKLRWYSNMWDKTDAFQSLRLQWQNRRPWPLCPLFPQIIPLFSMLWWACQLEEHMIRCETRSLLNTTLFHFDWH